MDQLNSHLSSKQDETECALCVLLVFLSLNLDNCRVFSMISLQFSIINIFLSFRGYIQFHSNSSEI